MELKKSLNIHGLMAMIGMLWKKKISPYVPKNGDNFGWRYCMIK